jgi:hypothetical protein
MLTLIGGITSGGGVELTACFGKSIKNFVKKFDLFLVIC